MNLDFLAVLTALGANAAFRIMNAARPPANYLFATFLPERLKATYTAKAGAMTIRPTMAGLVGMDSPYPPSAIVDASTFVQQIAKLANSVTLTEEAQRDLQAVLQTLQANAQASNEAVRNTILNFTDKLLVQSHLDAMEWLRGEALTGGAINWTFNKINLVVDYGVPSANMITARSGTDAYDSTTSKFWADMRAQRKALKGQVRARLAHPDTIEAIINNDVNKVRILAQDNVTGSMTIGRLVGSTESLSSDARDRITLIGYGAEGEVLDPANPGKTKRVPFLNVGKIIAIGDPLPAGFQVGMGATPDGQAELPIGYTHIGPTVEGGGAPGRWARVYTPEGRPWSLVGEGVTNGMPVIEAPEKISVATTTVS